MWQHIYAGHNKQKERKKIIMLKSKLAMLTMLLMLISLGAAAEGKEFAYKLKGCVVDSVTKEGEPYATLSIVRPVDKTKALKMAVTGQDGRFTVEAKGEGDYVLIVRSVGRNTIEKTFHVDAKTGTLNLGTLLCTDASAEIAGVEVVASKPLVKADIDKLTYSVEDDPESKAVTVTEMLKKVPMVTVDGDDNIKVKGSSSFKVYVNGKPNNMMTNNAKDVLKSMPASSVKKIEVITNPGPKYDAEGVGGILNIITTGSAFEGYTATLSAQGSNRGGGGGVFATVKSGKFTMSVDYSNNFGSDPIITNTSNREMFDDDGNNTRTTEGSADIKQRSTWHGGSLEASYEIDTLRLLSASFSMSRYGATASADGASRSFVPLTQQTLYSYNLGQDAKNVYNDISGGIDYQRSFKTPDRLLTLSYRIESSPSTEKTDYSYTDLFAHESYADFIANIKNQRTDGAKHTTEHTFQLDYTTPFAKHHTFETGVKYIIRQNSANTDKYDVAAGGSDVETYDEENSSHYKHRNDIFAAYLGYGLSLKKWSARLGLRYEHTLQDIKYLLGRGENFHKNFDDVVPSAKLGYKFSDTQNLSLNYKMRISRPGIWTLNPYLNDSSPESLSQGNSDLVSEKIHSFDIQFGSFAQKLSYTLSLNYDFTNNSIEEVATMMNDRDIAGLRNPTGKEVLYTTYRNIGKFQIAQLSAYASWNPFKNTRLTVNGSGGYLKYSDGQTLENHGWKMSVYVAAEQTIAKTWKVAFNIYKSTPEITLQGKGSSFFFHSFNVSKSWLDQRLNLVLMVQNPFKKDLSMSSDTSGQNFRSSSCYNVDIRRFGISLSYRFGKLDSGVKKAERSIVNDDVNSSGKSNGKSAGSM